MCGASRATVILGPMSGSPLVAIFLGTRPEAIKLAPVIQRFRALGLPSAVIGTGQHLELVDQVLHLFGMLLDVFDVTIRLRANERLDLFGLCLEMRHIATRLNLDQSLDGFGMRGQMLEIFPCLLTNETLHRFGMRAQVCDVSIAQRLHKQFDLRG